MRRRLLQQAEGTAADERTEHGGSDQAPALLFLKNVTGSISLVLIGPKPSA